MKTEKIRLTDVFFEKSADIVGMHFYRFCQVIQGDIVLIIFSDIFQKLLNLSAIAGVLMVGSLLERLFDSREGLENLICKPGKIICTGIDRLPLLRQGELQAFQI